MWHLHPSSKHTILTFYWVKKTVCNMNVGRKNEETSKKEDKISRCPFCARVWFPSKKNSRKENTEMKENKNVKRQDLTCIRDISALNTKNRILCYDKCRNSLLHYIKKIRSIISADGAIIIMELTLPGPACPYLCIFELITQY